MLKFFYSGNLKSLLKLLARFRRIRAGKSWTVLLGIGCFSTIISLGLIATISIAAPSPAQAAGIVGTGTPASCTDAALNTALAGGGLVTFNCGPNPVLINIAPGTGGTGTKVINQNTVINGGGLVTLSGGNAVNLFTVIAGVNLSLQGLTLSNGNSGANGGAIFNNGGTLSITNVTFSNNTAPFGGAIANSNGGITNVSGATFSGNSAPGGRGGAISNSSNSTLSLTNVTFSSNTAGLGGGLSNDFGGGVTVNNSTFSGNSAPGGGGGGVFNDAGANNTIILRNTIITNSNGNDCLAASPLTDGGNNLASDISCGFSQASSLNNTNPLLGPLANNGGPTQTFALTAPSPAINRGNNATCATTDQRGFTRPGGANCDIGAFELGFPALSKIFNPNTIQSGSNTTLVFTLTNPVLTPSTNFSFTDNLPVQIQVAANPAIVNNCGGGNITAIGTTITVSGVNRPANSSCTISVNVTSFTVGNWTNNITTIASNETGPFTVNVAAILVVTLPSPTASVTPTSTPNPGLPSGTSRAFPADLVAQLRVTPDRLTSADAGATISYTFSIKNIGQGRAENIKLNFPIDPNLMIGFAQFEDSRIWVSAIITGVTQPYLQISLPALDPDPNQILKGTVVFHPADNAKAGATIFTRYPIYWDDATGPGKKTGSNAVSFALSEDGSTRNDTGGAVQLFEPNSIILNLGSSQKVIARFYAPNEPVTFWYTDKNGQSMLLGNWKADPDGNLTFEFDTRNLTPGESYAVVGFGNRSEVSGSTIIQIASLQE
jgi:uncharacterized repeat protein (TIGR01451 family)